MNFQNENSFIQIKNLTVKSPKNGCILLKNISLNFYKEEFCALLGESGSGKTTLAFALMGLMPSHFFIEGSVHFSENWLLGKDKAMIFQDPQVSFNPFFTIGFQMQEVLKKHLKLKKKEAWAYLLPRIQEVGLKNPLQCLKAYPHQLSGGEKQRLLIAMALLCDPAFLIADEPTASLDLVIRVEILKLLTLLKKKRGLSILLITHDLLSALKVADRLVILKNGEFVEAKNVANLSLEKAHPYTQRLFNSRLIV